MKKHSYHCTEDAGNDSSVETLLNEGNLAPGETMY